MHITNVPEGALVSSYLQGAGDAVGMLGGLDDKPAEIKANGGDRPGHLPLFRLRREPGRLLHRHHQGHGRQQARPCEALHGGDREVLQEAEKDPDAAIASMADIVGGTMAEDEGKAQARAVLDVTLGVLYSDGQHGQAARLQCALGLG